MSSGELVIHKDTIRQASMILLLLLLTTVLSRAEGKIYEESIGVIHPCALLLKQKDGGSLKGHTRTPITDDLDGGHGIRAGWNHRRQPIMTW